MPLNKLSLKVSEETQLKLAKALYAEDAGMSGGASAGGLASASDLGVLPKVNFGGVGIGFEKRRRNRMRSEEEYTEIDENIVDRFLRKVYEWSYLEDAGLPRQSGDADNNQDATADVQTPPSQDDAETADEALSIVAQNLNAMYDHISEGEDGGIGKHRLEIGKDYMVSWADPRIVDNDALHKKQQVMDNGLHYVLFKSDSEAKDFYNDLKDKGIFNIKLDRV